MTTTVGAPPGVFASGYKATSTVVPMTGLYLWLDAADASTFTYAGGTVVSEWRDKSGGNHHAAQATGSFQPSRSGTQNGKSTVVFDGEDYVDYDAGTDAIPVAPYTMFLVCKGPASASNSRAAATRQASSVTPDYLSPNTILVNYLSPTSVNVFHNGGSTGGAAVAAQTWAVIRSKYAASSLSICVNGGTPVSTSGTPSTNQRFFRIGAQCATGGTPGGSSGIAGEFAEMLFYTADLTAPDTANIESYLRTKWGTP